MRYLGQRAALLLSILLLGILSLSAEVEDSRSYALEVADPYVKDGFALRYEFWQGTLKPNEEKQIRHQLFRGNEYWFWVAADSEEGEIRVNIYDETGNLVEAESWQNKNTAAARVLPAATGAFIVRVEVLKSIENEPINWSLAYGYK